MDRNLLLKAAPTLRKLRFVLVALRGRALILVRRLKPKSSRGSVVLLALGGGKGSPFVAQAVDVEGYDLYVVSAEFPSFESKYAKDWIKCDPLGDYDSVKSAVAATNPVAVLIEIRNILLPVKASLIEDLGLVDFGDHSAKTSNSKVELRKSVDKAGLPNISWCTIDDYRPDKIAFPFVVKPETGTGSRGVTIVKNEEDLDIAMERMRQLESDESVGGRVLVEQVIEGRQFDVEGVCFKGKYYPLTVTEEQYDAINGALPSAWFLFSPPIGERLTKMIVDGVGKYIAALGVINGAFHCEVRLNEQGEIFVIDYSNRMGYPLLVSECCGHSFPKSYLSVMVGQDPELHTVQRKVIYQRFIRSVTELASFRNLIKENPKAVVQKNMLGSYVGGVKTYARIALKMESFEEMYDLLDRYGLIPIQWASYYNSHET